MIKADNIFFKYGETELFNGFSFFAEKGEKVAVSGKSGYGKTTFLMMLNGMLEPDHGEIVIGGLPMKGANIHENRKMMIMLPQNVSAIGQDSVYETILTPFEFYANKSAKPEKECIELELDNLDLPKSFLDKKYSELSGGEKQRIGLIICKLLSRPIVLLDEPSSALDKELVAKAANYILSSKNQIVISVTHDPNWMNDCSRIVEFRNARS